MSKQKNTKEKTIPGDLNEQERLEQVIRVNHAGEFGAKRIYAGQAAILKDPKDQELINHMAEQEQVHLDYFADQLNKRHIRPTALMPLWHIGGFALGAATALMGKRAAMACTVAVEEVIDEHYQSQLSTLNDNEKLLKDAIEKFRQEELEHRDIGLENEAKLTPGYEALSAGIKGLCKVAIALSKRI